LAVCPEHQHQVLHQVHDAHGQQQRDVLVLQGRRLLEDAVVEPHADQGGDRNNQHQRQVRVEAQQGQEAVAQVGEEDDHGPLGQEDEPHGAEDKAEADGGDTVHGAKENAIDENLR
jgi:hypothetical protein